MKKSTRITKSHRICYVLACFDGPMHEPLTRKEVMEVVHVLEGKSFESFKPNSNTCYWKPSLTVGFVKRGDGYARRLVDKCSVLVRGYVTVAGKRGNELVYALTDKGRELADEYRETKKARIVL